MEDLAVDPAKVVVDKERLRALLQESGRTHYTYILRFPDGTPFYVGIGQGMRMFAHVEEARDPGRDGAKVAAIRSIWQAGEQVVHTLDQL